MTSRSDPMLSGAAVVVELAASSTLRLLSDVDDGLSGRVKNTVVRPVDASYDT